MSGPQLAINTIKNLLFKYPFTIIYVIVISLIVLASLQTDYMLAFLASEDSPIQIFSTIGYFTGFVITVILQWKGQISFGFGAAVIFLSMGLRELDFHDRFTTMGIMKTRFYISDAVPLTEKISAAIILLSLSYFIAVFLIKNFRPFLIALRATNKAALLTLNGIAFTILSKIIDSQPYLLTGILEETMELAIPYFFIFALLIFNKTEQNKQPNTPA